MISSSASSTVPAVSDVKDLTRKTFEGKVSSDQLDAFLSSFEVQYPSSSGPAETITGTDDTGEVIRAAKFSITQDTRIATGQVYVAGFFGIVKCTVDSDNKLFEAYTWGVGGSIFTSGGVLFTAYDSWDDFYNETHFYHAQGGSYIGGIFQITFMDKGHNLIGQYNSVCGGYSLFETGGGGKWKSK